MGKRLFTGATVEAQVAIAIVISCGLRVPAVLAQDAPNVTVEVGECVNLPSPEDRFECYERQVEAARISPTPAPPAPVPAADDATEGSQEIVATITAARQTVPNKYVITLDNGQIWRQTYAEWYPLQPGQRVRLRPSKWGGVFRLTADELNGYIQVQRVR